MAVASKEVRLPSAAPLGRRCSADACSAAVISLRRMLGRFVERKFLFGVEVAFQDVEENRLPNMQTDSALAVNRERRQLDRLFHLAVRASRRASALAHASLGRNSHQRWSSGR
jgi:hypothetical protein